MYDTGYDYEAQSSPFYGDAKGMFNPRLGFIKKVYGILACQIACTTLFVGAAYSIPGLYNFLHSAASVPTLIVAIVFSFITMIMLSCYTSFARTVPTNYILLSVFTLCESYMVAWTTSYYDPKYAVIAGALTASLTFALTIYACTTKTDFTYCGGLLFILGWAFCAFGFMMILLKMNLLTTSVSFTIYCIFGVILYGIYLIYDTQLIVGGKRYELSMDDYVIGAMMIYLDIIIIFLKILQMLGNKK